MIQLINITIDVIAQLNQKPADVKFSRSIDFGIENNEKNPKFAFGDHVRISKYKSIYATKYIPSQYEEVFENKCLFL